ncbi:unnamed protein product [Parajaminaea phylloscopi]
MPGVYGGDDVSAIVVDPGSSLLRAGWAGEDTPRVVIPSAYGWIHDESAAASSSSAVEPSKTEATEATESNAMDTTEDGAPSLSAEANGETNGSSAALTEADDPRSRVAKYLAKKETGNGTKFKKRFFGDAGVNQWRRGMEVSPTVVDGIVHSVSDLFHVINHSYETLGAESSEHPLMLTDSTWSPRETREELTEMAFEGLGVPAYYLANSTVLSSFSAGKPTSLILDVGYSSASAVPVVDGFVIRKGIFRQGGLGGQAISRALAYDLRNPPARSPRVGGAIADLVPQYRVKSRKPVEAGREASWEERSERAAEGATTDSFKQYHEDKLLHEAKESLSQVLDQVWDESLALGRPSRNHEFPTGYNDVFGIERFRSGEVLFQPSLWESAEGVLSPSDTNNASNAPAAASSGPTTNGAVPASSTSASALQPLPQIVVDAISAVDVDSRPTLFSNIVVVGGSTFIPGFVDRLSYELGIRQPAQKVKIHSPGNSIERRHSSWLGGSILASLGSFHQIWISKQEYEEHGSAIVHARAR